MPENGLFSAFLMGLYSASLFRLDVELVGHGVLCQREPAGAPGTGKALDLGCKAGANKLINLLKNMNSFIALNKVSICPLVQWVFGVRVR